MEKGLLFLTISMFCLWVILDEFLGDKRLSGIAKLMTPTSDPAITWKDDEQAVKSKNRMKDLIEKDDSLTDKEKKIKKGFWDKFYEGAEPN